MNLIEMIQGQLGSAVMKQASSFLGESESNTTKAMGAALPAVLGSLIQKGSSQSGASTIMDMLSGGNHDGSIFNNIGSLLGGGSNTSSMINTGSSLLKSLMGNKLGSVVDLISSFSGMGKSSSSSLLSMAAPMVMGMIGKQMKSQGGGVSGLMSLLSGQAKHVQAAAPAGLSNLMGFANIGGNLKAAGERVMDTAGDASKAAASGGSSILKWALPLLLILGAVYFLMPDSKVGEAVSGAADMATDAASTVADAAGDAAGAAADMASDAAGATADLASDAAGAVGDAAGTVADAATAAAQKALDGITFVAGSIGDQFSKFLESGSTEEKSFRFNNLTFDTNSATISEATIGEVNNFAALLKAHSNIHVRIDGYTDNTGKAEANKTLSQARADAVKAALVAQGIDAARITTMGHGADNPVASNDTEEGRTQNRRIEAVITKR